MATRSALAAATTAAGLLLLVGCTGDVTAPIGTASVTVDRPTDEATPTEPAAPTEEPQADVRGLPLETYSPAVLTPDAEATALWGNDAAQALPQGVAALKSTVYNDGLWTQTGKEAADFDFARALMTPGAYEALIEAVEQGEANTVLTFALVNSEQETVKDSEGVAFRQDPVVPEVRVASEPVMTVETDEDFFGDTAPRYAMTTTLVYQFSGDSLSTGERHQVAYDRPVTFYLEPDEDGTWLIDAWYSEAMSLVTE